MNAYTQSIETLMNELSRLPGMGRFSAERIAFHLLKQRPEDAMRLAEAIRDVKTRIRHCSSLLQPHRTRPLASAPIRPATRARSVWSSNPRTCWPWS